MKFRALFLYSSTNRLAIKQNEHIKKQTYPSVTLSFVSNWYSLSDDFNVLILLYNCSILKCIEYYSQDRHSLLELEVIEYEEFQKIR